LTDNSPTFLVKQMLSCRVRAVSNSTGDTACGKKDERKKLTFVTGETLSEGEVEGRKLGCVEGKEADGLNVGEELG
jgi:hypothetical protein